MQWGWASQPQQRWGGSHRPSLRCWLRSTQQLVEMGWHSTLTPGTSCVSLSSSQPESLGFPSQLVWRGKAWALPTQAAPMPRVERLWPQRAPGRGRWELWLSRGTPVWPVNTTMGMATDRTQEERDLVSLTPRGLGRSLAPPAGPSLANRFAPMKGQPKWSSQPEAGSDRAHTITGSWVPSLPH